MFSPGSGTAKTFLDPWDSFMTILEEWEKLSKKGIKMKNPTVCIICGKVFENPRKNWTTAWITCSVKCRKENWSRQKTGIKLKNRIGIHLERKKSEIIYLD